MMSTKKLLFVHLILFLLFQSCTWSSIKNVPPACSIVADSISFSKHIQPIFDKNCTLSGCHGGNLPAGNLSLESTLSYSRLIRKGSGYVDSINPKRSVLYSALISTNNPMPPSGKLDDCTLELIEQWMSQNAKNN